MKIRKQLLAWAIFLVLAGVFLLLKNLGIFGQWGDLAWGGLFAAVGLGFLVWFLFGISNWWRAIPGFTLLSVGTLLIMASRGINLGDWRAPLVLFGIALGFWVALLVQGANWWAAIPAGVLTLLGGLIGLQARLGETLWLGILFGGLGVVFLLVSLIRGGQSDARWSAIPAAALILLGIATLVGALTSVPVLLQWWPVLLLVGGLGLLIGSLGRTAAPPPASALPESFDTTPPAAGASVTQSLPDAASVPAKAAPPAEPTKPPAAPTTDIYDLIAQQPPQGDTGKP